MKTIVAREDKIQESKRWFIVDANDKVLGRMASQIAHILRGKHKPIFSFHQDVGDFIVVVNAEKVKTTGGKQNKKTYFSHSGYPGGDKLTSYILMQERHPERIIELAVKRMLPKNSLGRDMLKKLKVYAGTDHPHQAQQPQKLDLKY